MQTQITELSQFMPGQRKQSLFRDLKYHHELRETQREAVEKHTAVKKGTVIAPTGSGKSRIFGCRKPRSELN